MADIPVWNNRSATRLCMTSFRRTSRYLIKCSQAPWDTRAEISKMGGLNASGSSSRAECIFSVPRFGLLHVGYVDVKWLFLSLSLDSDFFSSIAWCYSEGRQGYGKVKYKMATKSHLFARLPQAQSISTEAFNSFTYSASCLNSKAFPSQDTSRYLPPLLSFFPKSESRPETDHSQSC